MKNYRIITFGCQMNEHDAEKMRGMLEQMGYSETGDMEEADLLLINTCCVRETAENKVYGLLGRLRKLKEKKPGLIIGVGGCMTQVEETARHIKRRYPYVNLVFGTGGLHRLPELIAGAAGSRETVLDHCRPEGVFEGIPAKRESGLKAWVPVIYGCDNFCTYCIVPRVRGRERSRRPGDIIREIKELAEKGYKEVTLLGQNVNSYGRDLGENYGFADLLRDADRIEGIERIRFMTSHPRDFTDRLISAIKDTAKVCEHFHIPVQSGSNRILKAMNRGYSREYYLDLIEKIRKEIPGAAITSDIMVGFPGETWEDFLDTMDLVERVRYDAAFTFVYNRRRGTPAERMPGQVPEEEKTRRIEALIKRQNEISLEKNVEEAGKVHQVLIEGVSRTNRDLAGGRTRTNKMVFLPGRGEDAGKTVYVKIVGGSLTHLEGEELNGVKCPCV
ncbi:MAG: tRNA (N6-isopentenyl adenosine(37)-C2)-methylthiotransferase MiaB [Peptococcaceae bacterium]|nr:tRNA (N6-isopentenyl adenosine(37)-C2)-methylthiotransferase MiaB [Peptococcaceae bacterium]